MLRQATDRGAAGRRPPRPADDRCFGHRDRRPAERGAARARYSQERCRLIARAALGCCMSRAAARLHSDSATAASAEQLMRSRYSAFAVGERGLPARDLASRDPAGISQSRSRHRMATTADLRRDRRHGRRRRRHRRIHRPLLGLRPPTVWPPAREQQFRPPGAKLALRRASLRSESAGPAQRAAHPGRSRTRDDASEQNRRCESQHQPFAPLVIRRISAAPVVANPIVLIGWSGAKSARRRRARACG